MSPTTPPIENLPTDGHIRVLLVDDHRLVRDGIKYQLSRVADIRVVGEAASGAKALALARELKPDVVLLDIRLAGAMDGFQTCMELKRLEPAPRVVLISGECREEHWRQVDECGADGFIQKECETQDYAVLIRQVQQGEFALSASLTRQAFQALVAERSPGLITVEERKIIAMLEQGLTNGEIAARLHLSESVVGKRLTIIYQKLNADGRKDALQRWQKFLADRKSL